jgi:hypothetical protein
MVKAIAELPIDKANSIMNDALVLIETISGKNTPVSGMRDLVAMGIRIGEIATAYHKYLEAGGRHFPTFFIPEQNRDSHSQLGHLNLIRKETQDGKPKARVESGPPAAPPPDGGGTEEAH